MVKIIIPGELTDLNEYIRQERSHRQIAAKTKKNDTNYVALFTKGKAKPITYRSKINFTWYCKNKMKDPDNISFAKKFIFDGLVAAGILEGDGWKNIGGFSDDFKIDRDRPRIEIEICEIGN